LSFQIVLSDCPFRLSFQIVLSDCPFRLSFQIVLAGKQERTCLFLSNFFFVGLFSISEFWFQDNFTFFLGSIFGKTYQFQIFRFVL